MSGVSITIPNGDFADVLRAMIARLGDCTPAMQKIGRAVKTSTQLRFLNQVGPDGKTWKQSARAKRDNGQTLMKSRRLFGSINWSADARSATVGTNVRYAAIHQFGGVIPPHIIRPRFKKALFWPGANHPVKQVSHPGGTIEARPFLGLNADDLAEIREIIGKHLRGES